MTDIESEDGFSLPRLIKALGRKPVILCVEDNDISGQLVIDILLDYCTVVYSPSGEEALKLVINNSYDLILMDIGLGEGMNGIETTKAIRQVRGYENVPVAAVTGYLVLYSKEMLSEAGIDYYLAKPFTKSELLNLIQDILIKCIYYAGPTNIPDTPIGAP
jgi:CheY-like chemotaxis protein